MALISQSNLMCSPCATKSLGELERVMEASVEVSGITVSGVEVSGTTVSGVGEGVEVSGTTVSGVGVGVEISGVGVGVEVSGKVGVGVGDVFADAPCAKARSFTLVRSNERITSPLIEIDKMRLVFWVDMSPPPWKVDGFEG